MILSLSTTDNSRKATRLEIGDNVFYFSYSTCIAFFNGRDIRIRRHNTWGRMTGVHMSQLGVNIYPVVDDEEFLRLVKAMSGFEVS